MLRVEERERNRARERGGWRINGPWSARSERGVLSPSIAPGQLFAPRQITMMNAPRTRISQFLAPRNPRLQSRQHRLFRCYRDLFLSKGGTGPQKLLAIDSAHSPAIRRGRDKGGYYYSSGKGWGWGGCPGITGGLKQLRNR